MTEKRSIAGIAFDLEGTIVDVEYAHHLGFVRAAEDLGIELTYETIFEKILDLVGGTNETISREIAALDNRDDSCARNIIERKIFHYEKLLKTLEIKVRPGFVEILKWLRHNGYETSIGTGTSKTKAEPLIEKSGLYFHFDKNKIVFAEDVQNIKPAPDVWYETARRMNIDFKRQIVFEDTKRGLQSVRNAGLVGIAIPVYRMPHVIKPLIDEGAARVFMDWREINITALLKNLNTEFFGQK